MHIAICYKWRNKYYFFQRATNLAESRPVIFCSLHWEIKLRLTFSLATLEEELDSRWTSDLPIVKNLQLSKIDLKCFIFAGMRKNDNTIRNVTH